MRLLILLLTVFQLAAVAPAAEPLPRVLILGDSVYQQPAREAAKLLDSKVEIVYATIKPGEVHNTQAALANLDDLLGDGSWDLIHFNFGLGDLVYRAPGMKAFRVMAKEAGGVRATSPDQYQTNLRELVKRLGDRRQLVWASTTPIRHSASNVFDMGSEIQYNAIAAKLMAEQNVPINDMYGHVKSLIDMNKPASHGADPFYFDKKPLHPPIVHSILQELNLPPLPPDNG